MTTVGDLRGNDDRNGIDDIAELFIEK